ncbi:MAG: hypothetical protein HQL50_15365 [Magnetococcales bacterium]|nr:hypothetical protein [Magnetococcales bacterium]
MNIKHLTTLILALLLSACASMPDDQFTTLVKKVDDDMARLHPDFQKAPPPNLEKIRSWQEYSNKRWRRSEMVFEDPGKFGAKNGSVTVETSWKMVDEEDPMEVTTAYTEYAMLGGLLDEAVASVVFLTPETDHFHPRWQQEVEVLYSSGNLFPMEVGNVYQIRYRWIDNDDDESIYSQKLTVTGAVDGTEWCQRDHSEGSIPATYKPSPKGKVYTVRINWGSGHSLDNSYSAYFSEEMNWVVKCFSSESVTYTYRPIFTKEYLDSLPRYE